MDALVIIFNQNGDAAMDKAEDMLARTLTTPNDVKECYGLLKEAATWYQAAKLLNTKLRELEH